MSDTTLIDEARKLLEAGGIEIGSCDRASPENPVVMSTIKPGESLCVVRRRRWDFGREAALANGYVRDEWNDEAQRIAINVANAAINRFADELESRIRALVGQEFSRQNLLEIIATLRPEAK